MSTNQSRRAQERVRDLRGNLLRRLRDHAPLTDLLAEADGVADGSDVIVPDPMLRIDHRRDGRDPPSAALAVMIVTGSSERENRQSRVSLVVQTRLECREQVLDDRGLPWLDTTADEVAAVVTSHADGWTALGASGGTPDPLWDGETNRYNLASRFDVESWG